MFTKKLFKILCITVRLKIWLDKIKCACTFITSLSNTCDSNPDFGQLISCVDLWDVTLHSTTLDILCFLYVPCMLKFTNQNN